MPLITGETRELDEALVEDVEGQDVGDLLVMLVVCRVEQLVVLRSDEGPLEQPGPLILRTVSRLTLSLWEAE